MLRQQDRWRRLGARLGAGFALSLAAVLPAAAQQIFINSLWVSRSNVCTVRGSKFYCPSPAAGLPVGSCPQGGNISNNPHIEFDRFMEDNFSVNLAPIFNQCASGSTTGNPATTRNPLFASGSTFDNYCNSQVMLCLNIGYANEQSGSADIAIDKVAFEVFKFTGGANALNPETTPPVRTFSIDAPGTILAEDSGIVPTEAECDTAGLGSGRDGLCGYCVLWDGSINIAGELGKSNGQYGFRGTVETNQTGANGNVNITQTRPYPSGTTRDCSCNLNVGQIAGAYNINHVASVLGDTAGDAELDGYDLRCARGPTVGAGNTDVPKLPGIVLQQPITVDVVNVHNVRSSATIVGTFSGVLAQPYSVTYRLGKDATTFVTVEDTSGAPTSTPIVRKLVGGLPRVGEGIPDGTLQNGDAWNGRYDNGDFGPPGVYLVTVQALSRDQFGLDLSAAVTRQISLDPLQITDILVQPLTGLATSLAVLTYTLTEPATVYIDIYPPGTQFCNGLNGINNSSVVDGIPDDADTLTNPGKMFRPTLAVCNGARNQGVGSSGGMTVIPPVRRIVEQKDFRRPVVSFWDGRDMNGQIVPDGDYVFILYGAMPTQNGSPHLNNAQDKRIWTSTAKSGFLAISRGHVTISQVTPATTVIGSSPAVAGLNPFIFSYQLSREAIVSLKVFNVNGLGPPVKTLVNREVRPANFLNREIWENGLDDNGLVISSGNYLIELTAADPFFPAKVATTTALFQANLFRLTDVFTTPLQSGSTENVQLSYQLSQTMNIAWNIYPPGTVVNASTTTWPPCGQLIPGNCAQTTLGGQQTKPFFTIHGLRPGRLRITEFWDGRDSNGLFVQDGSYVYTLVAQSTTTPKYFAADKIIGFLTITRGSIVFPIFTVTPTVPTLFNSSATITLPPFELDYSVTRQSSMTIQILTTEVAPKVVRTLISGQVRDANLLHKEFWDARDDQGSFVTPGFFTVQASASDLASALASGSTVQQTIAVDPLRIYDVAVSPLRAEDPTALISYQVSETMRTAVKIYKPGTTFDPNANPSPPEAISLVRRIVGVHPARIEITETWDGRDQKLALVPDGNYIFKIVGSTDIAAIDAITGNVRPGAVLAEDIPISEIPVVRGVSLDPAADFEQNTFIYPNPITNAEATFNIYVPIQSKVSMKIFNIAGELVYERDFGEKPSDTYVKESSGADVKWRKVNMHNRPVARGVYFALVREEETLGARNILQIVKKILVP